MPDLTPYPLRFSGGMHVGTRGVNLEEAGVSIPSDTLFAALLDALRRAGENVQEFADAYIADPPFLLTSAFPFVGNVRFYPMPVDPARIFSAGKIKDYGKKLGRIRYLSEGLLAEALKGHMLDDWLFPDKETDPPKKGVSLHGHSLWLKVDEIAGLPEPFQLKDKHRHAMPRQNVWTASRVPRVTIDRITSASNIFQAGKVEFADGCGLWFGVQWRRPEAEYAGRKFKAAFDTALRMLSEDGLGGERTTGYGAFSSEPGTVFSLKEAEPGEMAYLLSRYHPKPDEVQTALGDAQAAYELVAVGGWLRTFDGASQRRKRVFLVESGSLVRSSAGDGVMGDVVDVRPEYWDKPQQAYLPGVPHAVHRCGLALALGWPAPANGGAHG